MGILNTRCIAPDETAIQLGAQLLQSGEVVAFPTETVYGLGGNALDEAAILKIFTAKHRPQDNPLIVHVSRKEDAYPLCDWTDEAEKLADAFWPGPLTMLLKKKPVIPEATTAGLKSVAIRMPNHPVALRLIQKAGLPIAAPSANRSGRPSPTNAQHVYEDLKGDIPLVLDGGDCRIGIESTVVDLTTPVPTVYRPGGITPEQIAMVLGACDVAKGVMQPVRKGEYAPSPGMRHRHYAPKADMILVHGEENEVARFIRENADADKRKTCILAFDRHLPLYGERNVQSLGQDALEAAHRLFYLLRLMDEQEVKVLYAETLPEEGVGLAVMNRLGRAAAFHIVNLDQKGDCP